MIRFAFTLLVALGMAAGLALWWEDRTAPSGPADAAAKELPESAAEVAAKEVPESAADVAAKQLSESAPHAAAESGSGAAAPEEAHARDAKTAGASAPASDADPPAAPRSEAGVRPTLEEEPVEIVSRPDFAASGEPSPPDAEADGAASPPAPPPPVDVERSGDLIRRMLALYHRVSE